MDKGSQFDLCLRQANKEIKEYANKLYNNVLPDNEKAFYLYYGFEQVWAFNSLSTNPLFTNKNLVDFYEISAKNKFMELKKANTLSEIKTEKLNYGYIMFKTEKISVANLFIAVAGPNEEFGKLLIEKIIEIMDRYCIKKYWPW